MTIVTIDGYDIHFARRGASGRPTLLLHSTGVGSIQWMRFARRLKDRQCFVPDFLHYAPSSPWVGEGPPDWRIDLEACRQIVLDSPEPVDIIGHSYGGYIALHLAHDHPEKVRKMALHEPIAWGLLLSAGQPEIRESFLALRRRFFPPTPLERDEWLPRFVNYWNGAGAWEGLHERRQETWRTRFIKIYHEVRHLCFDPYERPYWSTISVPTRITVSENATPEEAETCRLLEQNLASASCVSTPGGHMAPITHSADVLPILARGIDAMMP